jgi:hypothetical protein
MWGSTWNRDAQRKHSDGVAGGASWVSDGNVCRAQAAQPILLTMQKHVPFPPPRVLSLGSRLHLAGMLSFLPCGCALAALGFALVLDLLSLRELLAQYGPRPLGHLATIARAQLEHPGAQAGELAAGLAGLMLVIVAVRGLGLLRR